MVEGTVDYDGIIDNPHTLLLDVKSRINGHLSRGERFSYVDFIKDKTFIK